jgi:hypothetical protein
MRCSFYHRLIHLHRRGELSFLQRALLTRHLRRCSHCAALQQQVYKMSAIVQRIREQQPLMSSLAGQAQSVLEKVINAQKEEGLISNRRSTRPARFYFPYSFPTRPLLIGLMVCIIAILIGQQVIILRQISSLEKRFASEQKAPTVSSSQLADRFEKDLNKLELYLAEKKSTSEHFSEEMVLVNANTLNELVSAYKNADALNDRLIHRLLLVLAQEGISFRDGLSVAEAEKLYRNKEAILKIIQSL